ncbi:ABC transporter permease [Paenirhodobacter populi]|uniref:ABC transporter permease n=1 Tax=Paenirhodobacter populi TaxID=2306993 RepID=A0A443JSX0_9RHOB|nr:iron chelate uptake ABC transporter family permease subunit [Sinirhodobacter populi]RWR23576.1 ABC transporter permease [Sinirhodobacter populi]
MHDRQNRDRWIRVLALAGLAALALASLAVGAANVSLSDPQAWLFLTVSRIPRTLAAMLAGAALAVAGVVMQQIARNRFVEPSTTGAPESAALGLIAVTLIAPEAPIWVKMLVASVTALMGVTLFLQVIRRLPPKEVFLVPLAGLILAGILGAAVTWIGWETDLLQYLSIWLLTGEFSGVIAGRYELLWIAGIAAVIAWFAADRFSILGLGVESATALGLRPQAVMRLGLVVVAVVTAMVVSSVGMIPFVGLVVPNIVSRMMGDNLRRTLAPTAMGGAMLVLGSDLVGRLVIHPYEIPAGTVLGVVGAALFLILLWRRPRRAR